jgi:maltose alpha-D-glucosyltransferase/alpha-amylase
MKGLIPVELMGGSKFPAIGDLPYLLTLGGHDFYWFTLEAPKESEERRSVTGLGATPVIGCTSVEALFFGDERPLLEEVLPPFLRARGIGMGTVSSAKITEAAKLTAGDTALKYVFVRVEYVEGEAETFGLPLQLVSEAPADVFTVAVLQVAGKDAPMLLVEATTTEAARVFVEMALRGLGFPTTTHGGKMTGGLVPGAPVDPDALREARVVSADGLGASIVYNETAILKLLYRVEDGMAPELEIARFLQAQQPRSGTIMPRVLGYVERRAPRSEPITVALIEELIVSEGTAWQHARNELGRVYERVLAHPAHAPVPVAPSTSLLEMAFLEPPQQHIDAVGAYREWALLLGRRTADLHLALASSTDPAFEPVPYSVMDQRSKYQSARNLVGRVLARLRRVIDTLPSGARAAAELLAREEATILDRFEPIRTNRIEAQVIRVHGNLHLGRVLFTGKDFVILGAGRSVEQHLAERRRKRGALRDVAGMIRSFHYAAAMSLEPLRPEDQARAEPWGWIWQLWAAAAFLRGYLETTKNAPFVPTGPMLAHLLEAAILERAFVDLRAELLRRPDRASLPIEAILRLLRIPTR